MPRTSVSLGVGWSKMQKKLFHSTSNRFWGIKLWDLPKTSTTHIFGGEIKMRNLFARMAGGSEKKEQKQTNCRVGELVVIAINNDVTSRNPKWLLGSFGGQEMEQGYMCPAPFKTMGSRAEDLPILWIFGPQRTAYSVTRWRPRQSGRTQALAAQHMAAMGWSLGRQVIDIFGGSKNIDCNFRKLA